MSNKILLGGSAHNLVVEMLDEHCCKLVRIPVVLLGSVSGNSSLERYEPTFHPQLQIKYYHNPFLQKYFRHKNLGCLIC